MTDLNQLLTRNYPSDCHPTLMEPLGSAGGMSGAQFWRTTTPRGTFVLRRWPVEHPTPDRLRFIHAVMHHAESRGITYLPVPIPTNNGPSFFDYAKHLWEFAPWMPGTANYEHSPSNEKLCAAMAALAQFHNAVANFTPSPAMAATLRGDGAQPAIPRRLARLRELTPDRVHELSRAIIDNKWPDLAPLARQFVTALPHVIPRAIAQLEPLANAPLPLQPCLRDIWHDHILFTRNEVTGLIDFGAVDIDTPATDIARLLSSLAGNDPTAWQTGLSAYSAMRPLSQNESLAVVALNRANPILAGCNWLHWIYIEHRRFEDPQQILTRFQNLTSRISVMVA